VKKTLAMVFMVTLLSLFGAHSAMSGETKTAELERLYGSYIDRHVSRCDSKAARKDSNSEHSRQEAALHCLMGHFYISHKTELIHDMIEEGIGTKEYQIEYYLNSKFFHTLREATETLSH
jgi:surfactin synthase thioesterase subunit